VTSAPIAAPLAGQADEPITAILAGPASGSAEGDASVAGHVGQGDSLLQKGAEQLEALEGLGMLGLREAAERGSRHR
jgi:hypothetical protein